MIGVLRTTTGVAVRLAGAIALAARAAHGTAQEFRLLVGLRETLAASHLIVLRGRLLRRCTLGASAGVGSLLPRLLEVTLVAAATILTVFAVLAAVAIAVAVLIVAAALPLEALIVGARLVLVIVLAHGLHRGLRAALVAILVAELIARLHAVVRAERTVAAPAVHAFSARSHLLVAESHDDAVVVLGVLQVILGEHRISG